MSIHYALIARKLIILAEFNASPLDLNSIAQMVLEQYTFDDGSRTTFHHDQKYGVHCIGEKGLTFLCIADESLGSPVPFAFLRKVVRTFLSTYGQGHDLSLAVPYGMNEFSRKLGQLMIDYSEKGSLLLHKEADTLQRAKDDIDQVKQILLQNLDLLMERGERASTLNRQTEAFNHTAYEFRRRTTELRRAAWWSSHRQVALLVLLVLVCGVSFWLIDR